MQNLIPFFISAVLVSSTITRGDEPLVFISAFASGDQGAIHAFQFDTKTGALKPLHRTTDIQNPFFLAISPDKRFLYAINAEKFGGADDEFVAAYAIEDRTGRLQRLNQQSTRGTASCYLDVDATGKTVVVANYASGSVASLPVQKDGSLGKAASFVQHSGSSVDPARQKGPNAHSIVVSPDNRFAVAADLGIDKIQIYLRGAPGSHLFIQPDALLTALHRRTSATRADPLRDEWMTSAVRGVSPIGPIPASNVWRRGDSKKAQYARQASSRP